MSEENSNKPATRTRYAIRRSSSRQTAPIKQVNRTLYQVTKSLTTDSTKSRSANISSLVDLLQPGTCYLDLGRQLLSSTMVSVQTITQKTLKDVIRNYDSVASSKRVMIDDDDL